MVRFPSRGILSHYQTPHCHQLVRGGATLPASSGESPLHAPRFSLGFSEKSVSTMWPQSRLSVWPQVLNIMGGNILGHACASHGRVAAASEDADERGRTNSRLSTP